MATKLDFIDTGIGECTLIRNTPFIDHRGEFTEIYRYVHDLFPNTTCQMNRSKSKPNVLRGLHTQRNSPQGKIIIVDRGEILDVVVDVRPGSDTFGQWKSFILTEYDDCALYVAPGFAHGFMAGEMGATVTYSCTTLYDDESAISVRWDDPDLGINWLLDGITPILSEKDATAPFLRDITF